MYVRSHQYRVGGLVGMFKSINELHKFRRHMEMIVLIFRLQMD
jgi:hypothetical protein